MKTFNSILATACATMLALNVYSQGPKVPAASPGASVKQTFGLTDISIDYSCPAVKGRTIWGGLVPYNQVWRTGANHATVIEFSTNVKVGDSTLKAGKYALFTIPGQEMWTIVLNKDWDQWGSFGYDKSKDAVRLMIKPETTQNSKERMAFYLDPLSDSTCTVNLRWEKLKVTFEIKASTNKMIQGGFDNMGNTYANAAKYYVDHNLSLDQAKQFAQMSLDIKPSFYNNYVMAMVMKTKGDSKEALKYAQTSKKMGDEMGKSGFYDEYKDEIAKMISDLGGAKK